MDEIEGVLLDIDGVLAVSWEPLPGAIETVGWLRSNGVPFRLITNTTTKTRADLATTLRDAGFDVRDDELITAVAATAQYLRAHHPNARCFVLSDGDATADLEGVELTDVDDAEVIVLGGASEDFTYPTMNRIFGRLMDGASLVGMHRNLYWRTSDGLELDAGAYIAGLEEATGREAVICGKPSAPYFDAALEMLGVPRRADDHGGGRHRERRPRRAAPRDPRRARSDGEVPARGPREGAGTARPRARDDRGPPGPARPLPLTWASR